jgi:hypothetical protein
MNKINLNLKANVTSLTKAVAGINGTFSLSYGNTTISSKIIIFKSTN